MNRKSRAIANLERLGLDRVPVVGHSLGAMFALWHAAAGSNRISGLMAIGSPAVALPRTRVRMPLSLLTARGLGVAVLRSATPRHVYRRLLGQGIGRADIAAAPDVLIEKLHLAACRPENARTVAPLMHAIDHFRRGPPVNRFADSRGREVSRRASPGVRGRTARGVAARHLVERGRGHRLDRSNER
jgi:pimeloyl-ACP methyl ester carboxylesterase